MTPRLLLWLILILWVVVFALAGAIGWYLGITLPWYAALPITPLAGYGLGTLAAKLLRRLRKAVAS